MRLVKVSVVFMYLWSSLYALGCGLQLNPSDPGIIIGCNCGGGVHSYDFHKINASVSVIHVLQTEWERPLHAVTAIARHMADNATRLHCLHT